MVVLCAPVGGRVLGGRGIAEGRQQLSQNGESLQHAGVPACCATCVHGGNGGDGRRCTTPPGTHAVWQLFRISHLTFLGLVLLECCFAGLFCAAQLYPGQPSQHYLATLLARTFSLSALNAPASPAAAHYLMQLPSGNSGEHAAIDRQLAASTSL